MFSSAFLLTTFNKAHAETEYKTPAQIIWELNKTEPVQNVKSKITDKIPFSDSIETLEVWNRIGEKVEAIFEWFSNINDHIAVLSVKLLAWAFEAISSIVLQIPPFLFTSELFKENMLVFSSIAIGLVVIGSMLNSIKLMFNFKNDDFKSIIKRFCLVLLGMGFAPFILEKTFTAVNHLTKIITKIGYTGMNIPKATKDSDGNLDFGEIPESMSSGFDTFALLLFDILLIGTLIPVALQNGRRFFDLFILSGITPLALSCWVFSGTRKYFSMWLDAMKDICSVQLVYAAYIAFIGLFIFMTSGATGGWGMVFRLIIVAGGFHRMKNPPRIVRNMMDTSHESIDKLYSELKTMFTLKSLNLASPVKFGKKVATKIFKSNKK